MMRIRKAQVTSTLVIMIASLIGLVVILGVTVGYGKIFRMITDKESCQLEFFISSMTKQAGKEILAPECEPHWITIEMSELTKKENEIIKKFSDDKYMTEYLEKYGDIESAKEYINHYARGNNAKEWVMNEIIAKEMKYCWDVTGQGKLDLFDEWWKLFECKTKGGKSCTEDTFSGISWKNFKEEWWDKDVLWPPNWNRKIPPTFCVLCSRIKFGDKVKDIGDVDSMGYWLSNNPVNNVGPNSKIPYAAYLQNDAYEGIWASKMSYTYSTNEAHAVLYARVNTYGAVDVLKDIGDFFTDPKTGVLNTGKAPESVQILKLIPYQNIQKECTYLVG